MIRVLIAEPARNIIKQCHQHYFQQLTSGNGKHEEIAKITAVVIIKKYIKPIYRKLMQNIEKIIMQRDIAISLLTKIKHKLDI